MFYLTLSKATNQNEQNWIDIEIASQTIEESTMSVEEKMNWTIIFSPDKTKLFIVVLLFPRNQSHFLPAYVSSHVDQTE